ncbi:MAG: DNA methyltransferase [Flavobacteriaceae bacterium]
MLADILLNGTWEKVCSKNENDEIYILGNPPYLGARMQKKSHKDDIKVVISKYSKAKKVDYIICWFIKASSMLAITIKLVIIQRPHDFRIARRDRTKTTTLGRSSHDFDGFKK